MKEGEKITVLMPVYNHGYLIRRAVDSVLNQSFGNFEFIIIDDGSEDNTSEKIAHYNDSRIVYKKRPHKGLASSLNYGLCECDTRWVARFDADDINLPDRLEKQVRFLKENPDVNILSTRSVYFNSGGKMFFYNPPLEHEDILKSMYYINPVNHSSVMYDRELVLSVGGYNKEYRYFEDYELWLRLRDKAVFRNLPDYSIIVNESERFFSEDKQVLGELLLLTAEKDSENGKLSEKEYNNISGWINFYYLQRKKSRKHFVKSLCFKNALSIMLTYFPEDFVNNMIRGKMHKRISSKFNGIRRYRKILRKLDAFD